VAQLVGGVALAAFLGLGANTVVTELDKFKEDGERKEGYLSMVEAMLNTPGRRIGFIGPTRRVSTQASAAVAAQKRPISLGGWRDIKDPQQLANAMRKARVNSALVELRRMPFSLRLRVRQSFRSLGAVPIHNDAELRELWAFRPEVDACWQQLAPQLKKRRRARRIGVYGTEKELFPGTSAYVDKLFSLARLKRSSIKSDAKPKSALSKARARRVEWVLVPYGPYSGLSEKSLSAFEAELGKTGGKAVADCASRVRLWSIPRR
jgi:hypothetical protein